MYDYHLLLRFHLVLTRADLSGVLGNMMRAMEWWMRCMQGSGVISSFITCFYTNHLLRMIYIHIIHNYKLPSVRSQIIIHLILKIFPQIPLGQLVHHSMFHDCFLFDLSKTVIRSRIDQSKISVKWNHRLPWRGITLIRGPRNTRNVKFHRSVTDDTSGYGTSLPSRSEGGR